MRTIIPRNNPATTYTLEDFVSLKDQDELTYRNLSILRFKFGIEFAEDNIIDYYMNELRSICTKTDEISFEDRVRYRYAPDLLSYDVYGTTQLDWLIMLCNGIIDPKDFDMKGNHIYAPSKSTLKKFISRVFNSEGEWVDINRSELKKERIAELNREG